MDANTRARVINDAIYYLYTTTKCEMYLLVKSAPN